MNKNQGSETFTGENLEQGIFHQQQAELDQKIIQFFDNLVKQHPEKINGEGAAGVSTISFPHVQKVNEDGGFENESIRYNDYQGIQWVEFSMTSQAGDLQKFRVSKTDEGRVLFQQINQNSQLIDVENLQKVQIVDHLNSLINASRIEPKHPKIDIPSPEAIVGVGPISFLHQLSRDGQIRQLSPHLLGDETFNYPNYYQGSNINQGSMVDQSSNCDLEQLTQDFIDGCLKRGIDITLPITKGDLTLFIIAEELEEGMTKYSINIFSIDGQALNQGKLIDAIYQFSDYLSLGLTRNKHDELFEDCDQSWILPEITDQLSSFKDDEFKNKIETFINAIEQFDILKNSDLTHSFTNRENYILVQDHKLFVYNHDHQLITDQKEILKVVDKIVLDLGINLSLSARNQNITEESRSDPITSGTIELVFADEKIIGSSLSNSREYFGSKGLTDLDSALFSSPEHPRSERLSKNREKSSSQER